MGVLAAAPAFAHDLEKTQVSIVFARDGSFVVDVANEPNWLKLRLDGIPGPFADRIVLWVDGREVRPSSAERVPVSPGSTVEIHRLRGTLPIDAHTLRWYYGLVIDPYPLTIRRADGRVQVEEIAGNAWSRTIDVSGQFEGPRDADRLALFAIIGLFAVPVIIRLAGSRKHENAKTRRRTVFSFRGFVLSWFRA